ncbi:MAG: MGMT family protein [Longimicrobiales bacterium]
MSHRKAAFSRRVYALVRRVPPGRIVSYGGVAALLGQPRAARGVGHALSALPDDSDVPWWRVVNRNGAISLTGPQQHVQRALLQSEGVRFGGNGRADWAAYGWDGGRRVGEPERDHPPRKGGRDHPSREGGRDHPPREGGRDHPPREPGRDHASRQRDPIA